MLQGYTKAKDANIKKNILIISLVGARTDEQKKQKIELKSMPEWGFGFSDIEKCIIKDFSIDE